MKLFIALRRDEKTTLVAVNIVLYMAVSQEYTWDTFGINVKHTNKPKPISRERLLTEVHRRLNSEGVLISTMRYLEVFHNPTFGTSEETIRYIQSLYSKYHGFDVFWLEEFTESKDPVIFF